MRKIIFTFLAVVFATSLSYSQVTTLWEKSATAGTKPAWETGNTTRGIAYGQVGSNHRLFVVNRHTSVGGKQIFIFNAATGDSVGRLDTTGISGGTLVVNDVEVSTDGKIFVCNLAGGGFFKVYRYDNETSAPVTVINFDATGQRLGDKITVTGSTADNSIIIWAADATANSGLIHKFTTTDNGATFTSQTVDMGSPATASSAAVGPLSDGSFYWNSHGTFASKHSDTGTLIGSIPSGVLGTGGSAIRYFGNIAGDEIIVANALGTGFENAKIIKVPGGVPGSAVLYAQTTTLGTNSAVGTGDVAIQKVNNFTVNVYVLSTNNGFGAYRVRIVPVLAGDYYIGAPGTGPGGSNPQFATLRQAFDVLNEATFTGDCNFYITSDITETYTPAVGLGLAMNPDPYTVTFKPYTGTQPVITLNYPTDMNAGPSGAIVIGIPSKGNIAWDSLRTTKNIVIDGSNTVGGTTRDLTIQSATNAHRNAIPLVIMGDVSNLTVKNTNVYYKAQTVSTSGNLFIGAVMIRSRNYLGFDWSPHNLLFENNHLSGNFDGVAQSSQGYGCYQTGTPNVINYPYNITLKDNLIEGKRRGISLYKAGSHNIIGNEVILNQTIAADISSEAIYAVDVDTNSVVNIIGNKISKVSSITNGATVGNTAISIESMGTYNVVNNMIYGFALTASNPSAYVRAIKNSSASATLNLVFNSIYMDNLNSGTGTVDYRGIYVSNGVNNVANNIVVSAEPDFASYCIYCSLTVGTLNSDYNDFYPVDATNGNVGYFNNAATHSLSDWQTASGQDGNSLSADPLFVSTTDLHLLNTGSPVMGKGMAIPQVTYDFDGETRDSIPEIGCDEFPGIIPVELASFRAALDKNSVVLFWTTASELNSSYFEIEKISDGSEWNSIGRVDAAGNSTNRIDYRFVDENVNGQLLKYRLKLVDLDGTFTYSQVVEVNGSMPNSFSLSQNYPNPFNPTTKINYTIPFDSKVTISVYSITGELVTELVNDFVSAGTYSVDFDGSNLASGMYIYKMTAGDFTQTNKMMLMK
ncbi:MAG TPA: T9SS type A sorting domain-containing protein [Ignavibacteriaceae bacterium]|jgi:hypothetical protein|nr:MAG: hypothetical protein BWY38_00408 [Ignavibacteria bacterium ADurb.Bin266]OQY73949.1 MAG: hypothetical protein B6D44_06050 [Ignavibacteriales bacterium UTCHB2]HQF41429.1 T9SS type A sorting domain-containing protein [Ignavibacteriaceae bacterium]